MSKQAPNFSARVIGWNRSPDEPEVASPESTNDAEVAPPVSATPLSKKDRLRARKVNAATSTIPTPVIHTAIGYAFQAAMRIVISAANPLNPGIPMDAADAMTKAKAAKGIV